MALDAVVHDIHYTGCVHSFSSYEGDLQTYYPSKTSEETRPQRQCQQCRWSNSHEALDYHESLPANAHVGNRGTGHYLVYLIDC